MDKQNEILIRIRKKLEHLLKDNLQEAKAAAIEGNAEALGVLAGINLAYNMAISLINDEL